MKTLSRTWAATFGAVLPSLALVPFASASCGGLSPTSWKGQLQPGQDHLASASLLTVADTTPDPIVGFWHVKFVAQNSPGVPDGTEIDAGYSQWHSDGTEILNSGARSPITSNFCLGVWQKLSNGTYALNHFAISWDPTGTTLIGPANIREQITLTSSGHFIGTFTITQYDQSGKILAKVRGAVNGERIDVNTPALSLF